MSGKGDTYRPRDVSRQQWETNWENIFGKKKKSKAAPKKSVKKAIKKIATPKK